MEKQNDSAPIEGKSYVEEFLEEVKDEEGNPLSTLAEDFFQDRTTYWLKGFCNELGILIQYKKAAIGLVQYLTTKHEQ